MHKKIKLISLKYTISILGKSEYNKKHRKIVYSIFKGVLYAIYVQKSWISERSQNSERGIVATISISQQQTYGTEEKSKLHNVHRKKEAIKCQKF